MFERFTHNARETVLAGRQAAVRAGSRSPCASNDGFIGTEHVLLGLLRSDGPVALATLAAFDLSADDVRRAVDQAERHTG